MILDHTEQFTGRLAAGKKKISENVRKLTKSDNFLHVIAIMPIVAVGSLPWRRWREDMFCPTVFAIYAILQRHSGACDTMLKTGKASCEQFV